MPAFLLKLMPFRDWGYVALAAAAVVYYNVHVHNLIVDAQKRQIAAVAAATIAVQQKAHDAAVKMQADYEARLAAAERKYEDQVAAATAAHDADMRRLQQYAAAYRDADRALHGAAGSAGESGTAEGTGGAGGVGELPRGLAVSLGLADALRADDALLEACRADRDSLTGK